MKNKLFIYPYIALLTIVFGSVLTGCDDEEKEALVAPSIVIDRIVTTNSTELKIIFTPSGSTSNFKYAIGNETDRQAFINGSLSTTQSQDGNEKQTITFSNLNEKEVYTIFATAYGVDGTQGPIASIKAETRKKVENFEVIRKYVTSSSAGFCFNATSDYYKFEYALGRPGDKEIFEKGVIDGFSTKEDISAYTANYFDLHPNTDYVFFVRGYDRSSGLESDTQEMPFTTAASGAGPEVKLRTDYMDIYAGDYTFIPNEHCSKIVSFLSIKDEYADVINNEMNWRGDLITMMETWNKLNAGLTYSATGSPLEVTYTTSKMLTPEVTNPYNYPLEAYSLLYDADGEVYGIQRFSFSTPAYQDGMGEAKVDFKISNINDCGAFYEFTPNKYTMGVLFETFDAEWYEKLLQSDAYYDNYIRDYLYLNGYWNYCHKVSTLSMPERSAEPGKKYYVFYLPMNYNGPGDGWGKVKYEVYTTLEKEQ